MFGTLSHPNIFGLLKKPQSQHIPPWAEEERAEKRVMASSRTPMDPVANLNLNHHPSHSAPILQLSGSLDQKPLPTGLLLLNVDNAKKYWIPKRYLKALVPHDYGPDYVTLLYEFNIII